jgi:hypothetical protein
MVEGGDENDEKEGQSKSFLMQEDLGTDSTAWPLGGRENARQPDHQCPIKCSNFNSGFCVLRHQGIQDYLCHTASKFKGNGLVCVPIYRITIRIEGL